MNEKKTRVVVAMSGGVDSSVAALILKNQGYEVIGISLKVWDEQATTQRAKTCCSFSDIQDARRVCERLEIPFYAFNYKEIFKEKVIDRFVSEYQQGRTPNPCILCNNHIKFDQLLAETKLLGADYLATGHHARRVQDEHGVVHLLKGKDTAKDQSYVLHRLTQVELRQTLFPVGDYTKEEIREMARQVSLPTAMKPESQDICFVPNGDYAAFVEKHLGVTDKPKGQFIDKAGLVVGESRGVHAYTIGQRRGLGLSALGQRKYVINIDVAKNQIQIGDKEELLAEGLIADNVSWVRDFTEETLHCSVKIRYQKDEIPSVLSKLADENVAVRFSEKYPAVTPGQAAVFYHGDEVIGGGWIR